MCVHTKSAAKLQLFFDMCKNNTKKRHFKVSFVLLNQDSNPDKPTVELIFVTCCKSAMILFKIRILCEFVTRF